MTSTMAPTAATLLEQAASAAARTLPITEPVTLAAVDIDSAVVPPMVGAVLVAFNGSVAGEFAIALDQTSIAALPPMAIAADDLASALVTVIDAVAAALGTVVAGVGQRVEPRVAAQRCAAHADHAAVALQTPSGIKAVVSIGVDVPDPVMAAAAAPADRLDLLRGVEMQASAELGRARMTIHDLLTLRTGAVIELDRLAGDPADLYVNGRLIARGEVVVVDENYAIRVTQIVSGEGAR